jgi:hypothetical protein
MDGWLSRTQLRVALLVAIPAVYVLLVGYSAATGVGSALSLAHLFFGTVLLVAAVLSASGLALGPDLRGIAAAVYTAAGLVFVYSGLARVALSSPTVAATDAANLALLLAVGAFLLQRRDGDEPSADES